MPFMPSLGAPYDFIVVGGGTSGPVVARRLADVALDAHVLLIEAGPGNQDIVMSRMAMGWQNIQFTEHEWGYDTEPQKHANNRVIHIPRGKFLGGCSGLNGTLMIRGAMADYDEWEDLGNKGWSWKDVLPLFKKSEKFFPTEGFPAAEQYHGEDGLLHTTVHPLAPISEAILESYIDQGYTYKPDMFVMGEGEGVGHATRTVHAGIRTSGADFANNNPPDNLHVLLNTTVLRILFEESANFCGDEKYKAVGVEAEVKDPMDGSIKSVVIKAKSEIILSAGAYNSPFILMHSGVGPREHLAEHNIETKVDLKGVGSNLSDHLIVFQFYYLNSRMTYDHLIYPPGALNSTVQEWIENKSGVMGRFPFGPFAFLRADTIMESIPEWSEAKERNPDADPMGQKPGQPHIEYFSTELYGGGPQHVHLPTHENESCFATLTMLCGPQSRGTVRLASSNPHTKPKIDHNYLSTPLDVALLAEGCRHIHNVVLNGAGTKDHVAGAWPKTRVHPNDTKEWRQYVRQQAGTCYHPSSTCKMGPDTDQEAVVDPRLRVRGVKGLRVADISVMPKLNNGHTQAPAYMIGEKAALLILEDHNLPCH